MATGGGERKTPTGCESLSMAALFLDGVTKFSGDDKTVSSVKWAEDLEDNAEIFGWTAQQKLIFARRSLTGTAELWLKSEKPFRTYDELKTALQKEFPDASNTKEMHEIMSSRKKQNNETYYEYMVTMKELGRRARFPDYVSVQYIIDGIPDYEPNKSILYGVNNYTQLKEKLALYEKIKSKVTTKTTSEYKSNAKESRSVKQRCYNCGDLDHVASECKKGIKCFRCNQFGHKGSQCSEFTADNRSIKQHSRTSNGTSAGGSTVAAHSAKQQRASNFNTVVTDDDSEVSGQTSGECKCQEKEGWRYFQGGHLSVANQKN